MPQGSREQLPAAHAARHRGHGQLRQMRLRLRPSSRGYRGSAPPRSPQEGTAEARGCSQALAELYRKCVCPGWAERRRLLSPPLPCTPRSSGTEERTELCRRERGQPRRRAPSYCPCGGGSCCSAPSPAACKPLSLSCRLGARIPFPTFLSVFPTKDQLCAIRYPRSQ